MLVADPTDATTVEPNSHHRRSALSVYGPSAALALVIGAMVAVMYATHRAGHWWGDDWALYIRQAQGLLDGNPGRVFDENRFSVEQSVGAEFSPPLYPWGFPIILAPFVAVLGPDVDQLRIVQVLCACVFACCWYALARRRLGTVVSLVGIVAVTLTPLVLSWTELIQSELPFLAVTGIALVVVDRLAASGAFIDHERRLAPLLGAGLAAAAAFSVRREGLAMVAAIGAAQLVALLGARTVPWRLGARDLARLAKRLASPYVAFLVAVGLLQVVLPSTVVPRYEGTGIENVWQLRRKLAINLASVSGLHRPWDTNPMVLGSSRLGWLAVTAYLVAAVVGMALAVMVARRRVRDAHLAAYALVAFVIGGSFRSAIDRYVCTVAPLLMLFGVAAVHAVVGLFGRPRVAQGAVIALLAAVIAGNVANANLRIDRAAEIERSGAIEWGPTHPDAIAMFDAVRTLTAPDDIVAAPKARAMVLEADRLSIQVDDYRPLPATLDVALIVTDRGTVLSSSLAGDPARYEIVWENARFVLFEPLKRANR